MAKNHIWSTTEGALQVALPEVCYTIKRKNRKGKTVRSVFLISFSLCMSKNLNFLCLCNSLYFCNKLDQQFIEMHGDACVVYPPYQEERNPRISSLYMLQNPKSLLSQSSLSLSPSACLKISTFFCLHNPKISELCHCISSL